MLHYMIDTLLRLNYCHYIHPLDFIANALFEFPLILLDCEIKFAFDLVFVEVVLGVIFGAVFVLEDDANYFYLRIFK